MDREIILSVRAALTRNIADLPFDLSGRPETAGRCIGEVVSALQQEGFNGVHLLHLRDVDVNARQVLAEQGILSPDVQENADTAALLQFAEDGVAVLLGGADHVCIRATRQDGDLLAALNSCIRVEEAIARHVDFACDRQLGYLTSSPKEVGTGLRAGIILHLPRLSAGKRMEAALKKVSDAGLELGALYICGDAANCCLYELRNRATLGCAEQECISKVAVMGIELCRMEKEAREQDLKKDRIVLEDLAGRALGTLLHARLMPMKEFGRHWSNLRLGAVMGMVGMKPDEVDDLLMQASPAHLTAYAGHEMTQRQLDASRASRVRALVYRP